MFTIVLYLLAASKIQSYFSNGVLNSLVLYIQLFLGWTIELYMKRDDNFFDQVWGHSMSRQEEVGRWFQKCSFLSTFRVKKDHILSTQTLNGSLCYWYKSLLPKILVQFLNGIIDFGSQLQSWVTAGFEKGWI